MAFEVQDLRTLNMNPFTMLNDEWALVTAGSKDSFNTMTISWGFMGVMWYKPVLNIVLRPQRFTKEFIDNNELFTVSFFPAEYKKALSLLGSKSGKNCDKVKESGLTPLFINGTTTFEEANRVFICKKLFGNQQICESHFVNSEIPKAVYPNKDFHHFYIGEIMEVLIKKEF
ncbi:MAG: flavin reductase [Firmicutes bacterium]|nr:flavin reductase [Bacillota bacterium]